MRHFWFFLFACLVQQVTWAASAGPQAIQGSQGAQALTDQQRIQLRMTLMHPPQALQPPANPQFDARRQLSDQERADLRQQLRAQQRDLPALRP